MIQEKKKQQQQQKEDGEEEEKKQELHTAKACMHTTSAQKWCHTLTNVYCIHSISLVILTWIFFSHFTYSWMEKNHIKVCHFSSSTHFVVFVFGADAAAAAHPSLRYSMSHINASPCFGTCFPFEHFNNYIYAVTSMRHIHIFFFWDFRRCLFFALLLWYDVVENSTNNLLMWNKSTKFYDFAFNIFLKKQTRITKPQILRWVFLCHFNPLSWWNSVIKIE